MIIFKQTSSTKELEQILDLQRENLPFNLSNTEKKEQGFLTVQHNMETLERMHLTHPHIIAKENNEVVGYALSMSTKFKNDIPVLKPMFTEIDNSQKAKENFIIMGQICVDKNFRGKGVFRGLYTKMEEKFSGSYKSVITEIDSLNTRSLNAHKAIGFEELVSYEFNNQTWVVVYIDI